MAKTLREHAKLLRSAPSCQSGYPVPCSSCHPGRKPPPPAESHQEQGQRDDCSLCHPFRTFLVVRHLVRLFHQPAVWHHYCYLTVRVSGLALPSKARNEVYHEMVRNLRNCSFNGACCRAGARPGACACRAPGWAGSGLAPSRIAGLFAIGRRPHQLTFLRSAAIRVTGWQRR